MPVKKLGNIVDNFSINSFLLTTKARATYDSPYQSALAANLIILNSNKP